MAIGTTVKVGYDGTAVQRGLARIKMGFKALGRSVAMAGKAMLAPFVKLMAVLAPVIGVVGIGKGIKDIIDYGGAVSDMANRLGVAAKDIVLIEEVFRRTGVSTADVATTLQRMGKNIAYGLTLPTSEAGKAMEAMGISAETLKDLNMAQQFERVGLGISRLKTASEQARWGMAIFGREGAKLVNTFKTTDAFDVARKSVGQLGDTMDSLANRFDHISDAFGAIKTKIRQFFSGVALEMLPTLDRIATLINGIDLTGKGKGLGRFIELISASFREGNLGKLIWESFKFALVRMGEMLVGILDYAAEKFTNAITDGIANTEFGASLGMKSGTGARMTPEFYMERARGSLGSESSRIARDSQIRGAQVERNTPGLRAWQQEQKAIKVLEDISRNTKGATAF